MSVDDVGRKSVVEVLQEFSIPLLAGVLTSVLWANLSHESYQHFLHGPILGNVEHLNFHFLVNDIFMVFFFGIATKEITESCLPGGALNPIKKALNPLLGTLGGVLGPVAVYFIWVAITGDRKIVNGWGVPTATDIALAWLVARMVFGAGHPAVSFLLLLAIADDGIGLIIIAVFYPDPHHPVQLALLLLVVAAVASAYIMRSKGVKGFWYYLLGPGTLSWLGLTLAHLHPALALVPVVPFMPSKGYDIGLYAEMRTGLDYRNTLDDFAHAFHKPVDFGLFAFGLANAGVVFSSIGNATWAVLFSLLIGKTLGIFLFSMSGRAAGFDLPEGMDWRTLFTAGLTAAVGLTVALFVAGVAFTDPILEGSAKMGALFSGAVALLALMAGRVLKIEKAGAEAETFSSSEGLGSGEYEEQYAA